MTKKLRWFLPILVAILGILAFVMPVLASIEQPDSLEIEDVLVFNSTKEAGDQLYLITCDIDYDILPDESVNELFIVRILDEDDSEIDATVPYAFYNQGYDLGVVAFYLESDEVAEWQSDITVQLAGNPLVSWNGSPPVTTTNSITWRATTSEDVNQYVSAAIVSLAADLGQAWSVEMTVTSQATTVLSDTGTSYFLMVVPYLADVAPYCLSQYVITPTYPEDKPTADTYSTQLEEGIIGTIFDLSPAAKSLGISRGALTAFLYYPFVVAFFILLLGKHKLNKGTMMLLWPFVIAGHFFGVPLIVTIMGGLFCLFSTLWVVYKGTTS